MTATKARIGCMMEPHSWGLITLPRGHYDHRRLFPVSGQSHDMVRGGDVSRQSYKSPFLCREEALGMTMQDITVSAGSLW